MPRFTSESVVDQVKMANLLDLSAGTARFQEKLTESQWKKCSGEFKIMVRVCACSNQLK